MATYYCRKSGNDANAGTSAGAAWLTIGKALTTAGSGDTVYVGAGTYRETVTVTSTPASTLSIIGDVDGTNTGDAGEVIWTAYTTNDTTSPAASSLVNLNGKSYLLFQKLTMVGGDSSASVVNAYTTASGTNITLRECALYSVGTGNDAIEIKGTAGTSLSWTIDRCKLWNTYGTPAYIELPTHSADYDCGITWTNCEFFGSGSYGIYVGSSGASSGKAGGMLVYQCTKWTNPALVEARSANLSTSIPILVKNCLMAGQVGLYETSAGQITEDYNLFWCATPRVSVSAGANSIASFARAPMFELGQAEHVGRMPRPFGAPMAGATGLLGWGNPSGMPSVDASNRQRPAGTSSLLRAVGARERQDTGQRETTTTQAGASSVKIVGPGTHRWEVSVSAAATTVAVYLRYDATYGGSTQKPRLARLANGECGVTATTATMSGSSGTWEQVSIGPFTPTAAGIVTFEVQALPDAGGGICYVDTWSVS